MQWKHVDNIDCQMEKRESKVFSKKIDLRLIIKTFTYINRVQVILMRVCVSSF